MISNFNAGQEVTFPLYIYGASQRGIPVEVNVMATMLFLVTVLAMGFTVWQQRRAEKLAAVQPDDDEPPRSPDPRPPRRRPASIESVSEIETRLLIGGERVAGDGTPLAVENPFTEETVATVATPSAEQLDAAIAAAAEAQRGWERTPAVERGEMLHEAATRMRDRTDELAELMTLEGGKPRVENVDEIGWTAAAFDYYAEIGRDSAGRVIPSIEASQLALVVKDPVGPVGCIVPWNYPLLLLAWKLAPALAAGNATVCKPSELTPLSTLALADCFDHLPAGVVNVVAGAGDVGASIVGDRANRVRRLHRLGRDRQADRGRLRRAGRARQPRDGRQGPVHRLLGRGAEDRDRRPRRRLGGVPERGPGLHLGRALLRHGATSTTSTWRRSPSTPGHSSSATRWTRGPTSGRWSPPPSARRSSTRSRRRWPRGAELVVGGDGAGHERGHFFSPAVVTGAAAETALLSEETFGPVAPLVRVGSLDEAIELANSTRFGLGANVYTEEMATMLRCMRELKAGTVWFNDPLTDNDAGPFGGFKQSGLGRELGREGLEAFQETKHVHIETEIEAKEWWYPYGD